MRRGAQPEPWNAWLQVRIGEILLKMGDPEGAVAAAQSAAALERLWHPDQPNPFFEQLLNRILGSDRHFASLSAALAAPTVRERGARDR
jgi:predicted Zn-dependent protease